MLGLVLLVLWFGAGALGARIATLHYEALVGTTEGSEMPAIVSVATGPIGLCAALLYASAFTRD